jgi:hypothetical protein
VRHLGLVAVLAAACVVAAGSALGLSMTGGGAQRTPGELNAFLRDPVASDAIPRAALGPLTRRFGRVIASRRVATASGFSGDAALYLVRLKRHYTCLIQLDHGGAGAGCSPSRDFLSPTRRVNAGAGNGFFNGVAGNDVARVAFVDRHGRLRPVRLTRDNGFLYVCRNRNGCIDVIRAVNGYDHGGRRVSHQVWP